MNTYLRFPDLKAFVEYLKDRRIHQYGIVLMEKYTAGNKGITIAHSFIRLTAKDKAFENIAVCDITLAREIRELINYEKLNEKKNEELKRIEEAFKGDSLFSSIDAEFVIARNE